MASIAGTLVVLSSCQTSRPELNQHEPRTDLSASTIPTAAQREGLPSEIAGFRFGISRDQATDLCKARGLEVRQYEKEFPGMDAVAAMTCVGLPAPAPMGNFVQLETLFCQDRLCIVKLVAYDGAAFEPLRDALIGRYGAIAADYSKIPKSCEGLGLADCLRNGTAQRLLVWTRTEGFPRRITSMMRLVHTASAAGEYIFLFFLDQAGSELLASSTNGAP